MSKRSWLPLLLLGLIALALAVGFQQRQPPATELAFAAPQAGPTLQGDVRVFFSRADDPRGAIKQALGETQQSVLVALYYLTDKELAEELVAAERRGVQVKVYLDKSQAAHPHSQARYLAQAGVPVRISSNRHLMHNKFAVLDEVVVLTGSYNWTKAAGKDNDENLLWIKRPDIAARYRQRFLEMWREAWDRNKTAGLRKAGEEEM